MATVVKPLDVPLPSPPSAPSHPETDRPLSSRWGGSIDMLLPADQAARTHRIVDGDTLAALAERIWAHPLAPVRFSTRIAASSPIPSCCPSARS